MNQTPASPELLGTQTPGDVKRIKFADRGDWMKLRGMDVTASVAGALFHEHQYVTAYGLYLEKAGLAPPQEEITPVVTEDSIVLPPVLRGTLFERVAIDMVRKLKPAWTLFTEGDTYYRMPSERIGATPDVLATRPDMKGLGIIQIKTTDGLVFRKKWMNEQGEVEIPVWIAVQAIVEAKLTGATWACVAVMIGGVTTELRLFDIPIHDGVWTKLVERVREFWRRVDERDAPSPDYLRDADLIAGLYPPRKGTEVDLSTHNRVGFLCEERLAWSRRKSNAERALETVEAEIVEVLSGAERAIHPEFNISRKLQRRKEVTISASEFPVLRITRRSPQAHEEEAA